MEKVAAKNKKVVETQPRGKEITKEMQMWWYEQMLLMRRFEEKAGQLYIQQKIRGFCHLYIGQEAIAAGGETAIRKDDRIITAYRDHAHPIVRGVEPKLVMAELFAKATGCSKGKGGSMHMFSRQHNFFGGHGIVGGQIPLGAGIAFADKYNGNESITICLMGDGAIRQGALHEAFNMAMLWKLPVLFCIENNNYAMGTSVQRTSNVHDLYKLGLSYDMPSVQVNGMSCEDVHNAIYEAADWARKGNGPTLLELKTYRYRGHSMSDPGSYRSKEEVEEYKTKHDPLEQVLNKLKENKWMDDKGVEAMEAKIKAIVEDSVKFADESPYPDPSELYKDVYMQDDYPYIMD